MTLLLHGVLACVALPVTLATLYLSVLTLLSARLERPSPRQRTLRFDVLVPAHDEAAVIERTVRSLRAIDWPSDRMRVVVIADNCTDRTAQIARDAGATVIERTDATRRGKGYALEFGIAYSANQGAADAVAVVDADTIVTPNLLSGYAARIERGAQALQARYGVLNPNDSVRTRLITIGYAAFHDVRSRARERLRASCGLRGNGMCFTHALLRAHPFNVYSLTEDLEYGIRLGIAGVPVHYVDEASADAELVSGGRSATTQRQRWEGGRMAIVRAYTGRLLAHALRRRSWISFELALDLLTLPLGYVGLQIVVLLFASVVLQLLLPGAGFYGWSVLALALLAALTLHVLRGWQLSGLSARALLDLLRAPAFIVWKLVALLRHRANAHWTKTDRESR
ncbi:glycosyltransferase [Pararobbsia silviterrae]|uniref:Glycosyltransferase n=1 Tax=Pararobbsia silviterrae TaxID=1792498 RepID=A0A494Y1P0_9BURK|nr:glycosyltransferase [Pararobbsia silviterrae]